MDTISTNSPAVTQSPYTLFVTWLAQRGMTYEHWLALTEADASAHVRAWMASPDPVHETTDRAIFFTLMTEPDANLVFRLIPTAPPAKPAKPEKHVNPAVETTDGIHVPVEYTDPDPGNIPAGLAGLGWPRDDEGALRIRAEKAGLRGEGTVADLPPGILPDVKRPTIWDNRWNTLGFIFLGLVLGLLMWDYLN